MKRLVVLLLVVAMLLSVGGVAALVVLGSGGDDTSTTVPRTGSFDCAASSQTARDCAGLRYDGNASSAQSVSPATAGRNVAGMLV